MNARNNTKSAPTEAAAVVEYGSADELLTALDAESMLPAALNSFDQADLLAAHAVVSKWQRLAINSIVAIDDTVAEYAKATALPFDQADEIVRGKLAQANADATRRIGTGSEGTTTNRVRLGLGEIESGEPVVIFLTLRPGTTLYSEGQVVDGIRTGAVKAMAVTFWTNSILSFTKRDPNSGRDEVVTYPDYSELSCYSHICALFGSYTEAKESKLELQDSLRTMRKAQAALRRASETHDPVRWAIRDDRPLRGERTLNPQDMPF